jgi:hypothetical protein
VNASARVLADDGVQTLERINSVLRGPVTDTLQKLIPALQAYHRREAYEHIMNNPHLAASCFKEFRKHPESFQSIVFGADGLPITADDQPLSCGRTLAQVIALIVRAIAKRYFRAQLNRPRRMVAVQNRRRPNFFEVVFGAFRPPPPAPPKSKHKDTSRADALYEALRDYLLYEWQVVLIPNYTHIPLALARELGARILEFRRAEQIESLIRAGTIAELAPLVATPDVHESKSQPDRQGDPAISPKVSSSPSAEVMWAVSQSANLPALYGCDEHEMRKLVALASGTGRPVMLALDEAGLQARQAVVVSCTIARRLGPGRMMELLGPETAPDFLDRFIRSVVQTGVGSLGSPANIKDAVETIIDHLVAARQNV